MKRPRVLIGAGASGSGKTFITCAVLKALQNRGANPRAFKCGPDYIDPMFHKAVLDIPAANADAYFCNENVLKALVGEKSEENGISVLEGVMGYYDGLGGTTEQASTYHVAALTETPVILVVPCKGMSLSVIPYIKGFLEYRENSGIKGVILNQIPASLYALLKEKIETELGIRVFGYLPPLPRLALESRHLGLIMPGEVEEIQDKLSELGREAEKTLDIGGIIEFAKQAPELEWEPLSYPKTEKKVVIGVARDEAFCFLYEDNIMALENMGAEIHYFSPLHDQKLPESISGLLLSGGYPELYAEKLSKNSRMRTQVRERIKDGIPCLAECGGFMYLHEKMEDMQGKFHEMAGVVPGKVWKTDKLGRFGYIQLEAGDGKVFETEVSPVKGHEFHYFESDNCGRGFTARKPVGSRKWECIHKTSTMAAGFPHIYYHSNLEFPYAFLERCEKFGAENK